MEMNKDSILGRQLNIDINGFSDSGRKDQGNRIIERILSMADTSGCEHVDYESLKRHNDAEANRRNTILRNETLLKNPMMLQVDLNQRWTFETMIQNDPATREHRQKAWDFINSVMEYSEERDAANLLILGASGSGKSHLAGAIAHELLLRRENVIYRSFPQLMFELLDNSSESGARHQIEMMISEKTRVLILDDIVLHKKKLTDFRAERLSNIIRCRHNANVSTILTANCNKEYLPDMVGDWCMSSIIELRPVIIDLKNASYGRTLGSYDLLRNVSSPESAENETSYSKRDLEYRGSVENEAKAETEYTVTDDSEAEYEDGVSPHRHRNGDFNRNDTDFSGFGY